MQQERVFQMLSYKDRYSFTGIIQKATYDQMFTAFKTKFIRTKETVLEYKEGTKEFRDKAKDKGGFIMGESAENRREKKAIQKRSMITLDLDYCPNNILQILENKVETKELPFRFFVYSTHSHTPESPRLRMIIPLNRDIEVEEYEPIATRICGKVGMEFFDATTTQANRIMYFPSVSLDGEYVCERFGDDYYDLDADDILGEFFDYHNIDEWQRPHYIEGKKIEKLESGNFYDSTKTRYRLVNAFNIEYSITEALDTFLTDVYKSERQKNRYTFLEGESRNGLHILNHQLAYSFHGSDPAQGRLLNAFDIVRIHKFGKQDQETEQQVYDNYGKSRSYELMIEWIRNDLPNVLAHDPKIQEQKEQVEDLLSDVFYLNNNNSTRFILQIFFHMQYFLHKNEKKKIFERRITNGNKN